jgi:tetratricopeptide (TPR) repeat protein
MKQDEELRRDLVIGHWTPPSPSLAADAVYTGLGLYGQARPLLEQAVATHRSITGDDPLVLSDSLDHLGDLLTRRAEFDAAEKANREAIRVESAAPNDPASQAELATTLYGLGVLLAEEGHHADAEKTLRNALRRQQALYGEANSDIAHAQGPGPCRGRRREPECGDSADAQRRRQRKLRGREPHPDVAEAVNDLALLMWQRGDYDEAATLFGESIAMYRRLLGDKHPAVGIC